MRAYCGSCGLTANVHSDRRGEKGIWSAPNPFCSCSRTCKNMRCRDVVGSATCVIMHTMIVEDEGDGVRHGLESERMG